MFDKRPIYLSGFSLGANVVVKCLGELGDAALALYNVQGAAVCGAPFDAERNVKQLDSPGFNRAIYSGNFLKTLKKRAQFQLEQHCDGDPNTNLFDYQGVMDANTVAEFDNGKSFWVMFVSFLYSVVGKLFLPQSSAWLTFAL